MSRKITFISDVHGDIDGYLKLVDQADYSYQLGDLFYGMEGITEVPTLSDHHAFIAGNHDHPSIYKHLNCLQAWHYRSLDNLFSVSGAATPLHEQNHLKKDGKWWSEEEMSDVDMFNGLKAYSIYKPDIMISHDAPDILKKKAFKFETKPSRTSFLLDLMYKIHQPDWWIFGHWHKNIDIQIGKTNFVCREIMGTFELEI